ncbi:SLAP domain-containing protein [Lactobacillus sp. ESL0791]|uniref:SLAP domain-containing protein n=1 Tax=Lactobacillus sp. ESL0791 TaxID=2983234 RepID=UPI0023F6BEBB|nr:SLAP domain-containing protein [Lactobacillus sp. ESL0791]MDF7639639.1 SLAP domain-containing protein [Lactobacillus sp. ESL0791]
MNIKKKIGLLSAMLLSVSPILTPLNSQPVQAAAKRKQNKLVITGAPYVYKSNGKRYRYYDNIPGLGNLGETDDDGYTYIDTQGDNETVSYTGKTITIKGKKYYGIGKNVYIKASAVYSVNGRNIQKGMLMLNHASSIYAKNGKKTKKTFAKGALVRYAGKIKTTSKIPKYFYYINNKKQGYLPTRKIKGKDYYTVGRNQYVNAKNVARINGKTARYNGTTTGILTSGVTTMYISNGSTGHQLKKRQKVRIDRAVIPWSEDFDGYIYHLHDYPNEYIYDGVAKLRNDLPITGYDEMAYRTFTPIAASPLKLYSNTGKELDKPLTALKDEAISADGLFYIWDSSTQKAELFYHVLRQNEDQISASDPERMTFSNSFVKASDIKFTNNYIKLKPVNSPEDAQADQVTATAADKQELQQLFTDGQKGLGTRTDDALTNNYDNALADTAAALRSTTVSRGEVKEITWLVKNTKEQLNSLYFEPWS